jgi:hypothetical protein
VELDRDEKAVFSGRMLGLVDHLDALRRLHASGMVTDELLAIATRSCQRFINTNGGTQWWNEVGPVTGVYEYLESLPRSQVPPVSETLTYLAE